MSAQEPIIELRAETAAWRCARDREERLRPGRDEAILRALAQGVPQRAVADAVGVASGLPSVIVAKARAAQSTEAKES